MLVVDKRSNIAGNIYTENIEGINVHKYGAHIFHTNNKMVWDYVNKFVEFNRFTNSPVANYKGELYSLPFNMYTFVRFENEILDQPNFQGNAAVNYTDRETPWTRIIEHKWFEFGKDENGDDLPKTIISREYSSEWKPGDEPYYPVNDEKNSNLYGKYKKLADAEGNVIFGGRLGEYKYYDMDATVNAALNKCKECFE